MHIKNILISGFRSYREQDFKEELSPKHNVIVGRNGSGKSNFFAAIQFVLSEKFATLRLNDRKELFHQGAGRAALAVFVEIVFDNSDGRIVIPGRQEEPEIRIRRTVGLKQDEFRVNDRKFSAGEIRQLLESAGFSSTNPYYIVEQGKIVNLANMKEPDRYQMLKDVAGTKVYEARREESERILEETATRHSKIDEAIQQLDDKLKILEAETAELRDYQEADRKRKSLEYCIFEGELSAARGELDKLDKEWDTRMKASNTSRDDFLTKESEAKETEALADHCQKQLERLDRERKTIEKERAALVSRRALAQLRVDDAMAASSKDALEGRDLSAQEKEYSRGLEKSSTDFRNKKELLENHKAQADVAGNKLSKMELQLEVLQAKRGRKNQFKTKAERDRWITSELKRNEGILATNQKEIARLELEMKQHDEELRVEANTMKERAHDVAQTERSMSTTEKCRSSLLAQRDALNVERRKIWQLINEQEGLVRRLATDFDRVKQQQEKSVRLDIRQGIASLHETLHELGDKRLAAAVHGQLIDLMTVDPTFENAVEVTAGNALFNVVVDSFDVSARLLDHMNRKKKPGRVTFFPLDTCKSLPRDIPSTRTCSSLLSHIHFEKKFGSVFAEIFGKTAVVTSMDAGVALSNELDIDAVTMDGDQFNRKGGITGGFFDRRNMRLAANRELKKASNDLAEAKAALELHCQKVAAVEQDVTAVLQSIEQASSQEAAARAAVENGRIDARSMEDRQHRLGQLKEQNMKAIDTLKKANTSIRNAIESLKDEQKSDFRSTLTPDEETELEKLQQQVTSARALVSAQQSKLVQLTTEYELLRGQIHYFESNLAAVKDRLAAIGRSSKADPALVKEVSSLDEEIRILDERLAQIEQNIEKAAQERRRLDEKAANLRSFVLQVSRAQQDEKDLIDRSHNQRVLLMQRKEDAQTKIRKLGVIPQDADKYSSYSVGKLMHLLKGVHDEMKKYAHVNKKAVDQYASLVETKTDLSQQRQLLEQELKSIKELMTHLDEKKGEAILRTFKQVQFNFEKVFEELVQAEGAKAELLLVPNPDKASTDPYDAVRVKVTFGLGSAQTELAQLSGGQKSLVALALIFAIQRCDPAPFYLFDEIDAALDAEYRTSVANVIRRQAESCQFITATFKTELLEAADNVLGIRFQNKVSSIAPITKEAGHQILRQAAMDDRKRARDDEGAQQL